MVTKTKKWRKQWDSQILGKAVYLAARVPFCFPALILLPFRRTSWEDCEVRSLPLPLPLAGALNPPNNSPNCMLKSQSC